MKKHSIHDLPIRTKKEIASDIGELIGCLHTGQRSAATLLVEDLKLRSIYLDESIQHDILIFIQEVEFQYAYDPWHKVTGDIQKAADKLIEDLGFTPPGKRINTI
jgi:hypothetical protein